MDKNLFANVDDIVRSLCADSFPDLRSRVHRYGVKMWVGADDPPRVHYEAQVLARRHVDGAGGLVLEIGLHAEHHNETENDSVLDALLARETTWRKTLGDEATAGLFFGAENWRRVSDVWLDPDLDVDDVDLEIASRLADYLDVLEPILADESAG